MKRPSAPARYIIAHKGGRWAGVASSDAPGFAKFVAGFIRQGFEISNFDTPEAVREALKGMPYWHEDPAQ